jgi:hypothetical protein
MKKNFLIALVFALGGVACTSSLNAGLGGLGASPASHSTGSSASNAMIASLSSPRPVTAAEPGACGDAYVRTSPSDVFGQTANDSSSKCKQQCTVDAGDCRTSCNSAKCANDCNKAERDCKSSC